jgi:hypothetical protein
MGLRLSKIIGSYDLDTLQIYFPWDDDLYTYFKERGLGQKGIGKKILPLIYSDNCESTMGISENKRKHVLEPADFGKTNEAIGWKSTGHKSEPIIPSEKPQLEVTLLENGNLKFRIRGRIDGKEQYHPEYLRQPRGVTVFKNWAIPVFSLQIFENLICDLNQIIPHHCDQSPSLKIKVESKNEKRELMYFVEIPINEYKFSIGEFQYVKDYFLKNEIDGILPSLVFKREPKYEEKMQPILKVGYIQTKEDQGFQNRQPQIALKVSQPKTTLSLREKPCKCKGLIEEDAVYENYFVVSAKEFSEASNFLVSKISMEGFQTKLD